MKQNKDWEMDDYRLYLQGHLRDHHFPEAGNEEFIKFRSDAAYVAFVRYRLEGHSVDIAQELAMRILIENMYVSRWDVVSQVLEEQFYNRLPSQEKRDDWAELLVSLRYTNEILDRHGFNGDYLSRTDSVPMLTELTGLFADIMDGYYGI